MSIEKVKCPFCETVFGVDWFDGFKECPMCKKTEAEIKEAFRKKERKPE